ncbi:unnamed protein product, partial [Staurois parvus]
MLSPSCPIPLVPCQCFLLALITVLVSLGMAVTPSQFPPVSEHPAQSQYKSLITSITRKKIPVSVICTRYNFHVNQSIYTYWDFFTFFTSS